MIFYTYYIPWTQIKSLFFEGTSIPTPLKQGLWNSNQNRGPHLGNPGISYINCHTLRGWPWGVEIRLQEPQDAPEGLPRNQGAAPNRLMHEYGRDFWSQKNGGGGDWRSSRSLAMSENFQVVVLFLTAFLFFLFFWSFSRFLNLVTGRSVTKILKDVLFMGLLLFGVHFWVRFWENLPKTRFGKFTGSGVFFCIFVIFLFHAEQKKTPAKIHMSSEKEPFFKRKVHLPTSNHRFLRDIWRL